jgi:ATP-dependent Clp protease ATP-binding subunit ClpB
MSLSLICVRIDSQIVFNKLSKSTLRSIVDLRLKEVQQRLDDRQISLNVDQVAKAWLTEHGYSPIYGARPLNRLIQNTILEPMAMELISGTIRANEEVKIRVEDEKLVVKRNHAPTVDPTDLTPPDMESESLVV